jgi:hypothetical protein
MARTRLSIPVGTTFFIYGFAASPCGKFFETYRTERLKQLDGSKNMGSTKLDITFPTTRAGAYAAEDWSLRMNVESCAPVAKVIEY